MSNIIKVPQLAWYDPKELELPVPDDWQVEVCNIAGYNRPAMTDDEIKAVISNPIGMPPIREMARGKNEVVIIFDDMTRATRVARIVPFVLEELEAAGIPESNIRFIAATGLHGPMTRIDFVKKLGESTLARFPVYNHNPFTDCTYVGTTSYGTKVFVNAEFMSCDLRIAIGSVTPHVFAVFTGGGKIILPGVSSEETIITNHKMPLNEQTISNYETNPRRLDMEEAAQLADLHVAIECIINMWGETVAAFAGAEVPAHEACVREARTHYITTKAEDKDIVITNTYTKASEAMTGMGAAASVRDGGDLVLITNAPEGQVNHYLTGGWGKTIGRDKGRRSTIPPRFNRLFLYSEYPVMASFRNAPNLLRMNNWDDVLQALHEAHGNEVTVAVYPNADISYFS